MLVSHRRPSQFPHAGRRATTAALSLAVAAFALTGALPAHATDGSTGSDLHTTAPAPVIPQEITPGDQGTGSTTASLPVITSSGLPTSVVSGETFTITVTVANPLSGAPVPTGEVFLIGDAEILAVSQLENGRTTLQLRPLTTADGMELALLYSGDENLPMSDLALGVLEVRAATAILSAEIPQEPVYSGGTMTTFFTLLSEDPARFGYPDGTLVLKVNGVEVNREEITGSTFDPGQKFLDPAEDLSLIEAQSSVFFATPLPDYQLGDPDTFEVRAHFYPRNGFTEATNREMTVRSGPAPTTMQIMIGDLITPPDTVTGKNTIYSLIWGEEQGSASTMADFSGTVRYFANDKLIGEAPVDASGLSFIEWTPAVSGSTTLRTEFIPATLNHIASSQESSVKVELPVVPDETKPDEVKPEEVKPAPVKPAEVTPSKDAGKKVTPASTTTKKTNLAQTGSDNSRLLLGGAATLLGGGAMALFLTRRRSRV